MKLITRQFIVAATALAAVTCFSAPVYAQRGRSSSSGHGQAQTSSQRGGGVSHPAPAPAARPEAQRPQAPSAPQHVQPQAQPPRAPAQRYGTAQPRQIPQPPSQAMRPAQGRSEVLPRYGESRPAARGTEGFPQSASRDSQGFPQSGSRGIAVPRSANQPRVIPSYSARHYEVRRPVFVQPYYRFQPRFSLNFGFRAGYGVAYPFNYWDPFAFYNYGFSVGPGYNARTYYNRVGGLSLEIDPYDAAVFIDGEYVGVAADFGPDQMPLTLLAGPHRIELRAQGFMTVSFDITIVPGQVIPYQGTMPYAR